MCEHWNLFVQTKVRVRGQAVMTQLVFEQSLRTRVKAEAPPPVGDANVPDSSPKPAPKKHSGNTENLLGKINNLVSSDLDTLIDGTDIFSLRERLR